MAASALPTAIPLVPPALPGGGVFPVDLVVAVGLGMRGHVIEIRTRLLNEQIKLGYCFSCKEEDRAECVEHESEYRETTDRFIATLPHIRRMLSLDAQAPDEIKGFSPPFLGALQEPGPIQLWTGYIARTAPGWSLFVRYGFAWDVGVTVWRVVGGFVEELESDDLWAKYNAHYWRRDFRGFLEFFFSQCLPEPHSTKQIEDCVGWGLDTDPETLIATAQPGMAMWRERLFVSMSRNDTAEVRLSDLARLPLDQIDLLPLKAAGIVPAMAKAAKVIKSGKLEKAVKLQGLAATAGAKAAIEAAGGSIA